MRGSAGVLLLVACAVHHPGGTEPDAGANPDGATSTPDTPDGMSAPPTAAELLAKLATCNKVGGDYAFHAGGADTTPICGLSNAVFWKTGMNIDCDGIPSMFCNSMTDPSFQAQTSATDSHGNYLDAAALPYVVVPLPSSRWDYGAAGLQFGSVFAVIHGDRVVYGVFGDEGPSSIIGESSYAMAQMLGIDPNPSTGGIDSGVAYIAFTGPSAVVVPIEDHAAATQLGIIKARALLQ